MQLRARHRGIDDLHDQFFERIVGRTISAVEHCDDAPSEMHYQVLTFAKPGEPDAEMPVVPVHALVRPHFAMSRQQVGGLQKLLTDNSEHFLKVLDPALFAQLHYCIGSVWAVAWLPMEAGYRLPDWSKAALGIPLDVDARMPPRPAELVTPDPSGSPSDAAALSGRAQRAVPPEASPEGRSTFVSQQAERIRAILTFNVQDDAQRLEALSALACIERNAPELLLQERRGNDLNLRGLRVVLQNDTGFAVDYQMTALGNVGNGCVETVVVQLDKVEPRAGELWPE